MSLRHVRPPDRRIQVYPDAVREAAFPDGGVAGRLWAGIARVEPGAATPPHHHGACETVLYVLAGRCRFRHGIGLDTVTDAAPGDFIYLEPSTVHAEEALGEEPLQVLIVRTALPELIAAGQEGQPQQTPSPPGRGLGSGT